jgi:GGDEF domain-containing protein
MSSSSSLLPLVLFAANPATSLRAEQATVVNCNDWADFLARKLDPMGFLICDGTVAQIESLAEQIRTSEHRHRLAYASTELTLSALASAMLDGPASIEHAITGCQHSDGLRRVLGRNEVELDYDERLLYHLFLREHSELTPVRDRQAARLYRYPLADALAGSPDEVDDWLAALTRRRLIEPAKLFDRTRHCRSCGSAHLHYIDLCPQCESLEIRKSPSLHCFTCGHVGAQENFLAGEVMRCPKCSTSLRHIGVDYDRPLTQYACGRCHHVFVEPSVFARCLDCDTNSDPGQLEVNQVSSLRLTVQGRAALRAGQAQEFFAALDIPNYVAPNFFRHLVDWALVSQQRHPDLEFILVLVEFTNVREMIGTYGGAQVYQLLDEVSRRLRGQLRHSDVSTRTTEERLWLFLPFTTAGRVGVRLRKVFEALTLPGGSSLEVHLRIVEAPRETTPDSKCEQLMERLQEAS